MYEIDQIYELRKIPGSRDFAKSRDWKFLIPLEPGNEYQFHIQAATLILRWTTQIKELLAEAGYLIPYVFKKTILEKS